jgi:hypothetical protein
MTFYINYTNGGNLASIADGTINTTATSLTLIGKNFPTYGQLLNQNLVSMLENYAAGTSPNNPLVGQLWYDSVNYQIKYYRSGGTTPYFQNLANIIFSDNTPTNPQIYDLWWDGVNQQLKMYDNFTWITIGPLTANDGYFRVSGSNSFIVQISGNNVLTVDAYGRVNAQYNPTLQGIGLKNINGGSTSITYSGSGYIGLTPQNLTVALGNKKPPNYVDTYLNLTTGVYTVPAAGIYELRGTIISQGNKTSTTLATTQHLTWTKNNSDTGINARATHVYSNASGTVTEIPLVATGFLNCVAGDFIQLVVYGDQSGSYDGINGTMSIRLVS